MVLFESSCSTFDDVIGTGTEVDDIFWGTFKFMGRGRESLS